MKKLEAFTLSELLVVLVITSIVVTLSFLALTNVQKQVRNVTQTFEKQQRIGKIERLLHSDLNRYKATYDDSKKQLFLKNSKDSVLYRFTENFIFREKDSMELGFAKTTFYLDGKEVTSGTIDALEFSFTNTYTQSSFFVYKRKDAAYYIN